MKQAMNKIGSQRGVSILMGLMLLLVATILSALVLTAALSSAQVKKNAKDSQQAYLTVSSAANVFIDEVKSMTYTDTQKAYYAQYGEWVSMRRDNGQTVEVWECTGYQRLGTDGTAGTVASNLTCSMLYTDLIQKAVDFVRDNGGSSYGEGMAIDVTYGDSDLTLDTVYLEFEMDEDFNITAQFYALDEGKKNYSMTVEVTPDQQGKSYPTNCFEVSNTTYGNVAENNGELENVESTSVPDAMRPTPSTSGTGYGPDQGQTGYYKVIDHSLTLTWKQVYVHKGVVS